MDISELKKLVNEKKAVKLDPNRKKGGRTSNAILEELRTNARTVSQLEALLKMKRNPLMITLRRLEKKGKLLAVRKGVEEYFVERETFEKSERSD